MVQSRMHIIMAAASSNVSNSAVSKRTALEEDEFVVPQKRLRPARANSGRQILLVQIKMLYIQC